MDKKCYIVKQVYNECCTGRQNWGQCTNSFREARDLAGKWILEEPDMIYWDESTIEDLKDDGEPVDWYTVPGIYKSCKLVLANDDPKVAVDCGDYTIVIDSF